MLGQDSDEHSVQKTLSDSAKLELIKAKFITRLCLFDEKGNVIGEAVRQPNGDFHYFAMEAAKIYFWSLGAEETSIAAIHAFAYPYALEKEDVFKIHINTA